MAPPLIESILHLGFRFNPTPKEVITYYLPRLLAGEPMHRAIRAFIHDTNIYACAPGVLAGQFRATPRKDDRFFFTTVQRQRSKSGKKDARRYMRVAGQGAWSYQKSEEIKDDGGVKIGEVTKLRYKFKNGKFADWLMEEYSCACSCPDAVVGDRERVFCRIYVSPNAGTESAARQESAAFSEQPAAPPEPVVIAHAQARKQRPAPPPIIKPPCPKRIRGAPISPIRPPPAAACTTTSLASPRQCEPQRSMAPPSATVQGAHLPRRSCAPSQQQARAYHVPEPRHLAPRAPPVEQLPLTPRPATAARALDPFALPDQLLSTETEDPFDAQDAYDELMRELDKIPTEEEAEDAPALVKQEADDETLAPPLATLLASALIPTRTQAPSVQATTVAQAPCSPVATRDPFCTESPDAAQNEDTDFDLVSLVEGALDTEQAEEDEAQDDTDCFAFPLANEQMRDERDPFAAAFAAEAKRMMRS
ncbi:hypothetical protein EJB05_55146, partial [Eragrostis curvula]